MQLITESAKDTIGAGRHLGRYVRPGDIICLFGKLGAGKTTLAKGIASGLGIKMDKLTSPSFVLIRKHMGKIPFYHFDFYRLSHAKQISLLGVEEYLYTDGVSVIEWPEKLGFLLPEEFLKVELFYKSPKQRLIKLKGIGNRYKELLEVINNKFKTNRCNL